MTPNASPLALDTATAAEAVQRAIAAGVAAAAVLPSIEPLTAVRPLPGSPDIAVAFAGAGLAGAAVADVEGPLTGAVAVLVGADLVAALSGSPLGGLDLAAAVQPAIDAAAAALGGRASAARTVGLDLVVHDLRGAYTAVPLAGSAVSAALLVTDSCLAVATPTVPRPAAPPLVAGGAPGSGGAGAGGSTSPRGVEMLHGVILDVTVELGRTRMSVRDLLALTPGTVLELDRAAGSPADLLVNGRLIARGEVVVVDEDFGLRVTEILSEPTAG